MHFDVTIITAYRVGTDSLFKYMTMHPDIYCPGYYGVDFRAHQYSKKTFTDLISCKRKVFIWHDGYTDFLYNGEVPVIPKYLIHPIRHPYEQAIACYNASLQHAIINNGTYPKVDNYITSNGRCILSSSLSHVNHYSKFKEVKVIDFSGLAMVNINRTMNDLYQWLGVDMCANFENDNVFHRLEVDFYLEKIPLSIEALNLNWNFYFFRKDAEIPSHLHPVGRIDSGEFGNLKVCLMKDELYTNRFGYRNVMISDVEQIIKANFSSWLNLLRGKIEEFNRCKISSLPSNIMDFIKKESQDDYKKVLMFNPEIEELWRGKWM
ncbi:hypothetical protein OB959_01090 [Aeromonas bestiarum]|uniref:Uncharacterized protein n=1 Tax=Aeromonas bestiarum TaxID=105751 RepID=A0AAW7I796_9GAMM|nr:hypothetical protein [Aeromonas bestiarum]MDM5138394.1 hypothetical protein [Aeromonas bestiarum]